MDLPHKRTSHLDNVLPTGGWTGMLAHNKDRTCDVESGVQQPTTEKKNLKMKRLNHSTECKSFENQESHAVREPTVTGKKGRRDQPRGGEQATPQRKNPRGQRTAFEKRAGGFTPLGKKQTNTIKTMRPAATSSTGHEAQGAGVSPS